MIIDSFPFFNEIELLDLRLNYLDKQVDKFVLVEGTKSHQGKEKKLYFDKNKSLFKKYKKKIIHHIIDDYPPIKNFNKFDPFIYDYHTRNSIGYALKKIKTSSNDILLISDVDEIPNHNFFSKFKGNLTIFKQYMLYFHMNLRCVGFELDYGDGLWGGTKMLYLKDFTTAQEIRNIRPKKYGWWRFDKPKLDFFYEAGWHFRFLGDEVTLFNEFKNRAIGYTEEKLNTYTTSDLKKIIQNRLELVGGETYSKFDFFKLPDIVVDNKQKYKKYLV
tara:strand:+ start:86 stop:907 length:822 start_codon:yes stop_codon:yes gene_type:complete